jgi:hypothetical protein
MCGRGFPTEITEATRHSHGAQRKPLHFNFAMFSMARGEQASNYGPSLQPVLASPRGHTGPNDSRHPFALVFLTMATGAASLCLVRRTICVLSSNSTNHFLQNCTSAPQLSGHPFCGRSCAAQYLQKPGRSSLSVGITLCAVRGRLSLF